MVPDSILIVDDDPDIPEALIVSLGGSHEAGVRLGKSGSLIPVA